MILWRHRFSPKPTKLLSGFLPTIPLGPLPSSVRTLSLHCTFSRFVCATDHNKLVTQTQATFSLTFKLKNIFTIFSLVSLKKFHCRPTTLQLMKASFLKDAGRWPVKLSRFFLQTTQISRPAASKPFTVLAELSVISF